MVLALFQESLELLISSRSMYFGFSLLVQNGVGNMNKKTSALLGIAGGFSLALLQIPLNIGVRNFGNSMVGPPGIVAVKVSFWAGMVAVMVFGGLLIIYSIHEMFKK